MGLQGMQYPAFCDQKRLVQCIVHLHCVQIDAGLQADFLAATERVQRQ